MTTQLQDAKRNVSGRPAFLDHGTVRTVRLSRVTDESLRQLSAATRISASALIREAVEGMLDRVLARPSGLESEGR